MPISVRCSCGKKYHVAEKLVGKKFQCKGCSNVLTIPRPVVRSKAKTVETEGSDDDSGFMDMDLDSEFSRMESIERTYDDELEEESPYQDARIGRRDPRAANSNASDAELAARYVPQSSGVEKSAKIVLGLAGIALGIGMIVGTWLLWTKQGIRWRGLGAIGIFFMIGGVKMLFNVD